MVLAEGRAYCTAPANGYCDQRLGACVCNAGYTGLSCEACEPTHYRNGSRCELKRASGAAGRRRPASWRLL